MDGWDSRNRDVEKNKNIKLAMITAFVTAAELYDIHPPNYSSVMSMVGLLNMTQADNTVYGDYWRFLTESSKLSLEPSYVPYYIDTSDPMSRQWKYIQ